MVSKGALWGASGVATLCAVGFLIGLVVVVTKKNDGDTCTTKECALAGSFLLASMDDSIDPCDDFYEHACGRWRRQNPKPTGGAWSSFTVLRNEITEEMKKMVESGDGYSEPVQKALTYYNACKKFKPTSAESISALNAALTSVAAQRFPLVAADWSEAAFDKHAALVSFLSTIPRNGLFTVTTAVDYLNMSGPKLIEVASDFRYSLQMVPFLPPDRFPPEGATPKLTKDTIGTIKDILRLLKDDDIDESTWDGAFSAILQLQSELLNSINFTQPSLDDFGKFVVGLDDFFANYDNFEWKKVLPAIYEAAGVMLTSSDRVLVTDGAFVKKLGDILNALEGATLANAIGVLTVLGVTDGTKLWTTELTSGDFCFNLLREEGGAIRVPGALTRIYFENKYSKDAVEDQEELFRMLRDAMHELMDEDASDWMDAETLKKAKAKLDAVKPEMGFPEWIADLDAFRRFYDTLPEMTENNFLEAALGLVKQSAQRNHKELREAVVPESVDWPAEAIVVNAFYYTIMNSIYITAAIAQHPFFLRNAPIEINLAALGVVIGHEITHGFDNNGAKWGPDGSYHNWWSASAFAQFTAKSQCFVEQYSGFVVPEIGKNVNGTLTLGENIADNGGIREAYRALQNYKKSHDLKKLPGFDDFTTEQIFFLAYANNWCTNASPEYLDMLVSRDPHSPGQFRVWGVVQNSKEFADAFSCKAGSRMNPEKKCVLW